MAKSRSSNTQRRDVVTSSLSASLPLGVPKKQLRPVLSSLSVVEDRRTFHPLRWLRPAGVIKSVRSRSLIIPRAAQAARNRFAVPADVAICVRRKQRREVLHALNKAGRGGQRKPRFNRFSSVRC
nr:MAG: hypothetical protein [Microvirus sp.]